LPGLALAQSGLIYGGDNDTHPGKVTLPSKWLLAKEEEGKKKNILKFEKKNTKILFKNCCIQHLMVSHKSFDVHIINFYQKVAIPTELILD